MLDIHSHILPKMDDGSKSVEMSVEMLRESRCQGITTMVSTSHFYADAESPEHFLKRRAHAQQRLTEALPDDVPALLYGAEVLYFPGISGSDEVARLSIGDTSLILIELPFVQWSSRIFDELSTFERNFGLHIVLAHVERYQPLQKRAIYRELFEQPFLFQCNAEAFLSARSRRLAFDLMDRGLLHFLGSDCHNTTTRPQRMQQARDTVVKRRGEDAWNALVENAESRFALYSQRERA